LSVSNRSLAVIVLALLSLVSAAAGDELSPEQANAKRDANVRVFGVISEALRATRPDQWEALPAALRDPTPWCVGERPAGDLQALRQFVLARFRAFVNDPPAQTAIDVDAVRRWLAEDEPLRGATIEFGIVGIYSVEARPNGSGVGYSLPGGHPLHVPALDRFMGGLTADQRALLLTDRSGLPLSTLTPEQRSLAVDLVASGSGREMLQQRAAGADARVRLTCDFGAFVRRGVRTANGPAEFYEVDLARVRRHRNAN
jgi:hypothetical protein